MRSAICIIVIAALGGLAGTALAAHRDNGTVTTCVRGLSSPGGPTLAQLNQLIAAGIDWHVLPHTYDLPADVSALVVQLGNGSVGSCDPPATTTTVATTTDATTTIDTTPSTTTVIGTTPVTTTAVLTPAPAQTITVTTPAPAQTITVTTPAGNQPQVDALQAQVDALVAQIKALSGAVDRLALAGDASWLAFQQAIAAGDDVPTAATIARGTYLNAEYGLGAFAA